MLEHTKRQVVMIKTNMFITAVCIIFLIKLRWPSSKSLFELGYFKKVKLNVKTEF